MNRFKMTMTLMVIILATVSTFAQIKISGKIVDKKGYSLSGVTVSIAGSTKGTISDFDGKFNMETSAGKKTLIFSFVGFEKANKTIEFKTGFKYSADVKLLKKNSTCNVTENTDNSSNSGVYGQKSKTYRRIKPNGEKIGITFSKCSYNHNNKCLVFDIPHGSVGYNKRCQYNFDTDCDGKVDKVSKSEFGYETYKIGDITNQTNPQIAVSRNDSEWVILNLSAIKKFQISDKLEKERQKKQEEERRKNQLEREKIANQNRISDAKNWDKGDKICSKNSLLFGNTIAIQAFVEDYNSTKTRFKVQIVKIDSNNSVSIDGVTIYRDAIIWIDITKHWWEKCN